MSVGSIKPVGSGLAIGRHRAGGGRFSFVRSTMPDPSAASVRRAPSLVVLGASGRAVAESARRSGFRVHAADLFADLDLLAAAETVRRVGRSPDNGDGYPDGLAAAAAGFPPGPWCYTGAIENHPDLIDRIAAVRPLAGNAGPVVRRVRDPFTLGPAVREAGLRFPETRAGSGSVPRDGSFLVKPLSSAGGRGIDRWTGAVAAERTEASGCVWQRRVDGQPCSAAFILAAGDSRLVGITRQLVGLPWCHAAAHAYCGSVLLPLDTVPADLLAAVDRLGSLLASRFRLVGAVGVDFVVTDDGGMVVIEVNPRPTASMELFERAGGPAIAAAHLAACGVPSPAGPPPPRSSTACDRWSKSVLFARRDVAVTDGLVDRILNEAAAWRSDGWPALADVPRPGQVIPAGGPVLTIFHAGSGGPTPPDGVPEPLVDRTRLIDSLL